MARSSSAAAWAPKSAKRIGVSDEFEAGENNKVFAFVDFDNAELGRLYTVHMIWLRPDEITIIFRKYAEVRVDKAETGYRSTIHWKSNLDLHYLKEEFRRASDRPSPWTSSMGLCQGRAARVRHLQAARLSLPGSDAGEVLHVDGLRRGQPEEEIPGDPAERVAFSGTPGGKDESAASARRAEGEGVGARGATEPPSSARYPPSASGSASRPAASRSMSD